jgi:hypothetical protein
MTIVRLNTDFFRLKDAKTIRENPFLMLCYGFTRIFLLRRNKNPCKSVQSVSSVFQFVLVSTR